MKLGLVGRKVGMTRLFTDDGVTVPVTVLDLSESYVTQIKNVETDGYSAVQVASGSQKVKRINKPLAGHLAKAGVNAKRTIREFRVEPSEATGYTLGQALSVDLFTVGQLVDVSGCTKGKGFSGGIKRHNFRSNRASHGNSRSHNTPGSTGQAQDPGRVFPGKRMPGQYG